MLIGGNKMKIFEKVWMQFIDYLRQNKVDEDRIARMEANKKNYMDFYVYLKYEN